MVSKSVFSSFSVLLLLPMMATAQIQFTPKAPPKTLVDSLMLESSVFIFKQSSLHSDTAKASLQVRVLEKGGDTEPVQGATVLLRRDQDKMLGRVTTHDGRCKFATSPDSYTVRVQMTGLKSFEKSGFRLEAGKVYDMEILMARN